MPDDRALSTARKDRFRSRLIGWFMQQGRDLPWRNSDDPYVIWLSEIILQQTRIAQGLPYFQHFHHTFPDVYALAAASEETIFKAWEGLGYYSRARNLHRTARIVAERGGHFPDTYAELLDLPGIGPYTAAAIASIAFSRPKAVVDGNVYRVLARFLGIAEPIDQTAGKKLFAKLAQDLLDPEQPAVYNEAIMDLGAMVCTPRQAQCAVCPVQPDCRAYADDQVYMLPQKAKKLQRRVRYFAWLVIRVADQVYIRRRPKGDIWAGLYDFPLIELSKAPMSARSIYQTDAWNDLFGPAKTHPITASSPAYKQTLTHQTIQATFWEVPTSADVPTPRTGWQLVPLVKLKNFAFPRIINWYLDEKSLTLNFEKDL